MVNNMNDGIHSIAFAGMTFLLYLFIMVSLFFLFSSPIETIMDSISAGAAGTDYETEMNMYHGNYVTAIKMAFALGIAAPITWFIMWVFSQEAGVYQQRRRY